MPRKLKPSPVQSLEILRETVGEEHQEALDAIARRDYSQKERDNMDDSDFGDPEKQAFPVKSQQDLENAARLIGHADNPDAVKKRLKAIAKRKGLTLPKSWQDEDDGKAEKSASPDDSLTPPKDPMNPSVERGTPTAKPITFYVPIERKNLEKREVYGTATMETEDAYGTVIRYQASKDAFARWQGNIREMHDKHKAVGRALDVEYDDAGKRIIVRAKISKGAEDTWQKILDGTLSGFSIGGRNGTWSEMKIGDRAVPALDRYDLAELSLVDNPGCPGANDLAIVRNGDVEAEVFASDAELDEEPSERNAAETAAIERVGAKHSAETKEALHAMRDQGHGIHKQAAETCNCEECQDHMDALNQIGKEGNDENVDYQGADDDMDRVQRFMAPVYQRLQHIAATLMPSENDSHYQDLQRENQELRSQIAEIKATTLELKAALEASIERSAKNTEIPDFLKSAFETLRADVAATKAQIDTIAAQPTPGGPALNAGALPPGISAAEKRFATQPGNASSNNPDSTTVVLDRLQRAGALSSPEAQVAAAALAARPMRGYIG